MEAALGQLDQVAREALPPCDDEPVFVCSIGWRTGSTLVQRILMTDPSVLIWGEPMDRLGVLDLLADIVTGVSPDWPPRHHFISHRPDIDLTHDWVALLQPDAANFKAGLRGLMDGWLAEPARRRGFPRWGVKEVRWAADRVMLLRWLYPKSRVLLLVRHPVFAFLSLKRMWLDVGLDGFWERWPQRKVDDLDSYARYWNELAQSWADAAQALQPIIIHYEALSAGAVDFGDLGARLGLELRPDQALQARVGASPPWGLLTPEERDRINLLTAPGRALFGYGE